MREYIIDNIRKTKNLVETFKLLKDSPFRVPQPKYTLGDIDRGVPYFLPRRLNKKTRKYENITKFGIDIINLGWKTKFDDYRHEWNPGWSIVLFGKQLTCVYTLKPDSELTPSFSNSELIDSSLWEAWLTWEYDTDKNLSFEDRFDQLCRKYECTWCHWVDGKKICTDYYNYILKPEYLILYYKTKQTIEDEYKLKALEENGND